MVKSLFYILYNLKKYWQAVLFLGLFLTAGNGFSQTNSNETAYSVQMAESVIERSPNYYGGWDYVTGTMLKAFEELWLKTNNNNYYYYIKRTLDYSVNADGSIDDYKLADYNIDEIRQGNALLFMYRQTETEKYVKAAQLLHSQLESHPRTSEGGFWHKQRYPNQMWLDGLYMGSPFLAQYAADLAQPADFDDVANQILLMEKHLKDSATGLYYHGWDESREQEWANPQTGKSPSFWGRGMGWFAMAIIDVLDVLPENHHDRQQIITVLANFIEAIAKYQDTETGLWYQVIDKPDSIGNYHEASASCMFVYTIAKAARLQYIAPEYRAIAQKGFNGIINHLVTRENGILNLNQICQSAGLGYGRDGTYNYYINETEMVSNDGKGIGPFILAAIEFDSLQVEAAINQHQVDIGRINIYPNPAKDRITISIANQNHFINKYTITNVTGIDFTVNTSLVKTDIENQFDVDISQLKAGVYIVKINTLNQPFIITK